MDKLNVLWVRYATPRNRKIALLLLALASLAVAGGAPSAGGGGGSVRMSGLGL